MITAGKIKVVRQSRDGDEVILAVLSAGDFCGEMALLDGMSRSADAVAAEETHLYGLNRKDFLAYVMNNETAVKAILSALSKRLRKADDFLEDIFFLNVAARLAKKLIELAMSNGFQESKNGPIKLSVTQKDLAGMIGATRESVNKELRALREKNLVSLSGSAILIHNLEALKQRIR
jgi:CRP-like cAMP-binding protein